MPRPLVVVTDSVFPSLEATEAVLSALDATVRLADGQSPQALVAAAYNADALLVTYAQIGADVIGQLQRCQVIARYGIGVDNVDIAAATKAGILVTRVPDYCVDEVSDHALALLLALARKVTEANQAVQEAQWTLQSVAPLRRLRGRILGLVGLGQIPRKLAPKAQALGLRVIAFDPYVSPALAAELGVNLVSFDELLRKSRYVSIHAPLTEETYYMFNSDAFQRMQPGALLINTARGPLVEEAALIDALDRGHIGGAALDVLSNEPPDSRSPLLGRSNVILTPHVAFYSEESMQELQHKAAEEVARVLMGRAPRYPVNQVLLDHLGQA